MINLGENCRYCLCAKCKHLKRCGTMNGDTEQWCEDDCFGENSKMTVCSEFEW